MAGWPVKLIRHQDKIVEKRDFFFEVPRHGPIGATSNKNTPRTETTTQEDCTYTLSGDAGRCSCGSHSPLPRGKRTAPSAGQRGCSRPWSCLCNRRRPPAVSRPAFLSGRVDSIRICVFDWSLLIRIDLCLHFIPTALSSSLHFTSDHFTQITSLQLSSAHFTSVHAKNNNKQQQIRPRCESVRRQHYRR